MMLEKEAFLKLSTTVITEFNQNSLLKYIVVAGGVAIAFVVLFALSGFIQRAVARWKEGMDATSKISRLDAKYLGQSTRAFIKLLFLFILYLGFKALTFSPAVIKVVSIIFLVFFTLRGVQFLSSLAALALLWFLKGTNDSVEMAVGKSLLPILRIAIWILGFVFLLHGLGFQVTALLAGLGIVGMALGLAGQTIIADFFSYIVLLVNRPFVIGDTISIGGTTGAVEKIGLKTTILRSPTGEQIVMPNADLTTSKIDNYRAMQTRSEIFRISVAYETPYAKVALIPDFVKEIINTVPKAKLDRAHFVDFGDTGLVIEIMYTAKVTAKADLCSVRQAINLGIMERLEAAGIAFARPAQDIYTHSR